MTLTAPHELFRDALRADSWQIEEDGPLWKGPNPSRVLIRRGRIRRRLLVYAWNITLEGKGRKKAGREDLDYRVQSTRSHEGDFLAPPGHLPVGLGWHEEFGVFGGFDVWVKRTTGTSSSVHLSRALLIKGSEQGWAEELREDGPTCAWTPDRLPTFMSWLMARSESRVVAVDPLDTRINGEELELRLDPRQGWQCFALRVGDYLVLRRDGVLLNKALWQVTNLETDRQQTAGGNNKPFLNMQCKRHGVVRNDAWLD